MNFFKYLFASALILIACFSISCKRDIDYPSMIDNERTYTEVKLEKEQMNIYTDCIINKYYTSSEYKVFLVTAEKGYVSEINLLVLLKETTIQKIQGVDIKETEGYGMNCFAGKYLSKFEGIDLSKNPVIEGKSTPYDEGDIVYVTHATVTSKAIISAINAISAFLNNE